MNPRNRKHPFPAVPAVVGFLARDIERESEDECVKRPLESSLRISQKALPTMPRGILDGHFAIPALPTKPCGVLS